LRFVNVLIHGSSSSSSSNTVPNSLIRRWLSAYFVIVTEPCRLNCGFPECVGLLSSSLHRVGSQISLNYYHRRLFAVIAQLSLLLDHLDLLSNVLDSYHLHVIDVILHLVQACSVSG